MVDPVPIGDWPSHIIDKAKKMVWHDYKGRRKEDKGVWNPASKEDCWNLITPWLKILYILYAQGRYISTKEINKYLPKNWEQWHREYQATHYPDFNKPYQK